MLRPCLVLSWILFSGLALVAGSDQSAQISAFRLLLSEVRPGGMATDQRCTLVFPDHRFHHEIASRHHGRDVERKVYEGELSEADWDTLAEILDRKEFQDLNVPRTVPPLVMQDVHVYAISVAREGNFQNMEFLTDKSRKPYDSQLKPLLQWWKSFYGRHMSESNAPPDRRCSMDTNDAVFTQ
jgi:hypothetical protein